MVALARIRDVAIVDDNRDARETLSDELRHAHLTPHPLQGPFRRISELLQAVRTKSNAAICDHHLIANYAHCVGADVVASLYTRKFPAVLVTAYSRAEVDQIRLYRRSVPVLLTPEQANPEAFIRGWRICLEEFTNRFRPSRRPWRTLLRIEDVDTAGRQPSVCVILPGWNSSEVVRIPLKLIPENLRSHVRQGERLFADVNKGAEDQSELYFQNFEYQGK